MSLLDAIVLAASELPDPGHPSIITLVGGSAAFLGWLVGLARARPHERIKEAAFHAGFVGFGLGFAIWLAALAIDRL